MKAHVSAEGPNTTAAVRTKPANEGFQGVSGMVAGLTEELCDTAETTLHVLSAEFGVLRGDLAVATAIESEYGRAVGLPERANEYRLTAAGEADVTVIRRSADAFDTTAGDVWSEIVGEANPDSIWCVGAVRNTLGAVGFKRRGEESRRVGVARIGTETREDRLRAVDQNVSE